ncbi:MAG: N-acetylmuramoyl-L-alanine amidase [Verrucomicrobiota bacterium]|nr:N-acetylmuramoyl-L-alanine amidase [Verrucomicrobiota bacterium]
MNRRIVAMARHTARGLFVAGLLTLAACASAPAQSAPTGKESAPAAKAPEGPTRAAPTRPAHLWPFTKIQGIEWVKLDDVAAHYRLKTAWSKPGVEMTLADARGVRLRFEANQRDFHLDGVRVFLGRSALLHRASLWVTRLDVIKTIAPLLRPEDHLAFLPAAPPKVIVIDAGHGGNDPGKQNLKLKLDEKDMTLDVVLRLKKLLELRGFKVKLTRDKDERLANEQRADLDRRAAVSKEAKADLFLSIHFNAVEPRDAARVTGTETYVLTPQFQWSSTDNGGDSLTNTAFPGNRQDVANVVAGYQLHWAMLAGLKTSDRGFKRGRLRVLIMPECPAALLEAAYLSNDKEAARVGTPEFRQEIAESIAEGVQSYAALIAALRPPPPPDK